ncbi:MAG: tRNA (adenosine(37)-N6)-threonylcarbamoyltransferase complex ATPase subunit type 1 TsaE, partial [Methanobacteriaceae archaeon]|nr:tRNA (adenosine(37)-N6)-threonylcarbamoyltransferase complex ATPase subunit type 1 TsaE [Methanobacteriaceae archaeon]
QVYQGRITLVHAVFYRLESAIEVDNIGFSDYLHNEAVALIEWGNKFLTALPRDIITLSFETMAYGRQIQASTTYAAGERILEEWSNRWLSLP